MKEKLNIFNPYIKDINRKQTTDVAYSTFVPLSDSAKFFALESILKTVEGVFGPLSGSYVEIFGNHIKEGQSLVKKSHDGHEFIKSNGYIHRYVDTLMGLLREKTLYISRNDVKTSRDGTTSLVMVSASVVSDIYQTLLGSRNSDKIVYNAFKRTSKSALKNILYNINAAFVKNINERRLPVYVDGDYVEDGYKLALNAISTTVAGDVNFISGYSRLMKTAREKKLNIARSLKSDLIVRVVGERSFDMVLNTGIRIPCYNELKTTHADLARNNKFTPVFFLDGHMSNNIQTAFMQSFKKTFIDGLMKIKNGSSYMFDPNNEQGLNPPVFLINRKSEALIKLAESSVVKLPSNGALVEVRPQFLFIESEEGSAERYKELLKLFSDCVIDLNGYRRLQHKLAYEKEFKTTLTEGQAVHFEDVFKAIDKEIELLDFPSFRVDNGELVLDKKNFIFNPNLIETEFNTITSVEEQTVKFTNCLCKNMVYNGSVLFLEPVNQEINKKIDEQKEYHMNVKKSYKPNSEEADKINRILELYNTVTLVPTITCKTDDEFELMKDVYFDAQGIFESVHLDGLRSAGNTTLLKIYNNVYEDSMKFIEENLYKQLPSLTEDKRNQYNIVVNAILESIYRGYARSYKILLKENNEVINSLLEKYKTMNSNSREDVLESYNIDTGAIDSDALEANKTTLDTFSSMIDYILDVLTLTRVRIDGTADVRDLQSEFNDSEAIRLAESFAEYMKENEEELENENI